MKNTACVSYNRLFIYFIITIKQHKLNVVIRRLTPWYSNALLSVDLITQLIIICGSETWMIVAKKEE